MSQFVYVYLFISLIALGFSYIFTIIEFSYLAINPLKLKYFEDLETDKFMYIKRNSENKRQIYSTTLILDYFSNVTCSSFGILFFYHLMPRYGILVGIFVTTLIIIIFGEVIPQTFGTRNLNNNIVKYSKFIYNLNILMKPLRVVVAFFSTALVNIRGGDENYEEPLITEDDLKHAFNLGHQEGLIDKSEFGILENVMEFKDTYAKDIMTPRTDMSCVDINSTFEDIINIINEVGYSRIPIYENDLDNIVGILHVKDLFTFMANSEELDLYNILRPAFFTYESKPIPNLFNEMRLNKMSVAIVLDEYGGTEGLITTEDLIEKIVGDISDEYDIDEDDIIQINNKDYLIEGTTNLSKINSHLNLNLESEEYETIAGYIIEKIDRFPEKFEFITIDNLDFIIREASKNRIDKVSMKIKPKDEN